METKTSATRYRQTTPGATQAPRALQQPEQHSGEELHCPPVPIPHLPLEQQVAPAPQGSVALQATQVWVVASQTGVAALHAGATSVTQAP